MLSTSYKTQDFFKECGSRGGTAIRRKIGGGACGRALRPGEMLVQVAECPRCGGRHSILAKPLVGNDGFLFAECRATWQPILFNSDCIMIKLSKEYGA